LAKSSSRFKSFNSFIIKRHRAIIIAWILALVLSVTLIPSFFSAVNYNITNTNLGGPKNQESQITQNIMNQEFPSSNSSSGQNSIILVVQTSDSGGSGGVYSDAIKNSLLALNHTLSSDSKQEANYTGMSSIYSTEYDSLNSSLPAFLNQTSKLQANVTTLNSNLYQLQSGINQTALLIYGVPAQFLLAWNNSLSSCNGNIQCANNAANTAMQSELPSSSIPYYNGFFQAWNSSTYNQTMLSDPLATEQASINATMPAFLNSLKNNTSEQQLVTTTWLGLNVTTWTQKSSIANLAIDKIASSLPSSFASSLGVSARSFIQEIYNLGGGSSSSSPTASESWNLASKVFSNATKISFSKSPLFTINATSLSNLLGQLTNKSTPAQISSAIQNLIVTQSYKNFPLVLSKSLTESFVSSDNSTMIILFNYSFLPTSTTIDGFRSDVSHSNITTLSKATYVTGGPVVSQDLSNVFTPALGVTLVAGVIVSIIIVGILFLAPLAAIIPLLIGGLSIVIAYAAIYFGIVEIGRGQITFLTPTLTTLLMLGLAVDYSVLQLRRTKEERVNGRSKEESVATSVRWAGEAVLTAGITVIVAYIVMAVANVPVFSDVGTAIALGVSILLLASMTLLPSLELAIGDRLFWPSLRTGEVKATTKPSILEKISEKTIRHKVAVALVITLFAAGAVYSAYSTPTGLNFLRLIPNFESNQGLTAITNNLGSAAIAPTVILVLTPTPIVYGHNQWNETLLNEIELISSKVDNLPGVSSLTSPTRPYGSPFNYYSLLIQNTSDPLYSQYLGGMLSDIGKNNKTALILVGLSSSSESANAVNTLLGIQNKVKTLSLDPGTKVYYGGDTQGTYDSQTFINGILPQVLIILAAAVYVILLLQLRSAFTPLRLVFTILCSVAFALALLSITFYYILNMPIFDFAPLFVVVTMLGVGIDYDIFYVTRIREEVLSGKSDKDAIKTATTKVWVTIFGLGLVLSSVFGSLLVTGIGLLQEISLAVSTAVLIDVSVVILFFVPSLMAIAEKFNWWPSKKLGGSAKNSSALN
jgi:RND superfamily putative drug exporter